MQDALAPDGRRPNGDGERPGGKRTIHRASVSADLRAPAVRITPSPWFLLTRSQTRGSTGAGIECADARLSSRRRWRDQSAVVYMFDGQGSLCADFSFADEDGNTWSRPFGDAPHRLG